MAPPDAPPAPREAADGVAPDWSREAGDRWWAPGPQVLRSIRSYQRGRQRGGVVGGLVCGWNVLRHRFWSAVAGCDIPLNCQLGGGLMLRHPVGIVIHPDATIGPNCLILQQVTVVGGVRIGAHVDIGAGAKIVRPVRIGDRARIGANAVVLTDVPEDATAVGVPARVLARGSALAV